MLRAALRKRGTIGTSLEANSMAARIEHILRTHDATIHAVPESATVADAVDVMNLQRIGSVLVIDGLELHGIVSERDVLHRVIGEGRSARETFVHEVMTRRLWTVTPATSVQEAMALVTASRCRHLPVLDGGTLVGVISIGDLMAWMVRDLNMEIVDLATYIHGPFCDYAVEDVRIARDMLAPYSKVAQQWQRTPP
jgi:signal-transduction protein with cAMP-binding, CBS, and nucleotidyltransferase domain